MTVNSLASNVRRCVTLLGLLILWEAGARVGWMDPFYLPPPSTVGRVMFTLAVSGELWPHLGATAVAAFAGLLVGLGLGIGLEIRNASGRVISVSQQVSLRVTRYELEFLGKERNKDVTS